MVMKTPGVYIVEKNAFPNSVVEVETAVPAFIGYTQKADNKGTPLKDQPWRISTLNEYHEYFGFEPPAKFEIIAAADSGDALASSLPVPPGEVLVAAAPEELGFTFGGKNYTMEQKTVDYVLYDSIG